MIVTTIDEQHKIRVPDAFYDALPPGQRVAVSVDAQGRMVVTPVEHIQAVLRDTFGLWSDRPESPRDGTEWVDTVRRGQRLDALTADNDENS